MENDFDEFRPKNGWAIFAMIVFAVAFFAFLVSIFIYETQRDKPKPWWCWLGFIVSIVLLVVAFATFAFINIGGTKGYHHRMRYAPEWQARTTQVIDPSEIVSVQTKPTTTYIPQTPTVPIISNTNVQSMNYSLYAPTTSLL